MTNESDDNGDENGNTDSSSGYLLCLYCDGNKVVSQEKSETCAFVVSLII